MAGVESMKWGFWWEFCGNCNTGIFQALFSSTVPLQVPMRDSTKNSSLNYSMRLNLSYPRRYQPGSPNNKNCGSHNQSNIKGAMGIFGMIDYRRCCTYICCSCIAL